MKSSKGKARPKPPENAPSRSRFGRPAAALACVAIACAIVWFLTRDDPQGLLRQAEVVIQHDPEQAARLLERSIYAAGGDFPQAQLLLCEALGRQKRWIEAWGAFSLIKDPSMCDGVKLVQLAREAFLAGELAFSQQALEAARSTSVPEADVLAVLIPVRVALDRVDEALSDCRRLATLLPDDPAPRITEARLLRRQREVLRASEAYRVALERTRSQAETATVRRELIELLVQQGAAQEARRELDQLPQDSQGAEGMPLLRAHVLRLEGRYREALVQVEEELAARPENADALQLRGTLWFDLEDYQRAAADLARLAQIEPFNKECHYKLGQTYRKLGRLKDAEAHLKTSERLTSLTEEIISLERRVGQDPQEASTHLRLAELYDAIGRPELAEKQRRTAKWISTP